MNTGYLLGGLAWLFFFFLQPVQRTLGNVNEIKNKNMLVTWKKKTVIFPLDSISFPRAILFLIIFTSNVPATLSIT